MTKIWERLYIGGIADAEDLAGDNPGITTVLSLCECPVETKHRGVNYLHLPIVDDEPVPVHQFDAIMDALIENLRWGSVLLHCGVGVSRAPSLAAAYMDAVGCMSMDAALKEIKQLRPFIHPSTVLVESLKEHLK
jgi:dual specificity phosphatase 12